jgi:pimeloyl-ACP methyl ester carboxylesterase
LTDEVWQALPSEAKRLARGAWRTIHRDLVAGTTYRVRPSELATVETKVLLLRGGRSRRAFEASLHALNAALPHSRLALLPSAGHHLSGEAWPELAKALSDFMDGRVL